MVWVILSIFILSISFRLNVLTIVELLFVHCEILNLASYYSELNGVSVTISVTISLALSQTHSLSHSHTHTHVCSLTSAVRYSKMAALYTAAVAPTRPWLVVLFFKCLWILPTGNCKKSVRLARAFLNPGTRFNEDVARTSWSNTRYMFLRIDVTVTRRNVCNTCVVI